MNYRLGIRTQKTSECLVQFTDVGVLTGKLIGEKVVWKNENKRHVGRITGFHGKNGVVIVRFKKGVPGQALGTAVELVRKKS